MYRITLHEAQKLARDFNRKASECDLDERGFKIKRNKASGAMVRASMELTRKLADLRGNR